MAGVVPNQLRRELRPISTTSTASAASATSASSISAGTAVSPSRGIVISGAIAVAGCSARSRGGASAIDTAGVTYPTIPTAANTLPAGAGADRPL